jgi:hypothetical protein
MSSSARLPYQKPSQPSLESTALGKRVSAESSSVVEIRDVSSLLSASRPKLPAKLSRGRSNSLPSSPSSLTPRSERTFKFSSLALPASLQQDEQEQGSQIRNDIPVQEGVRQRGHANGATGRAASNAALAASDSSDDDSSSGYGESDTDDDEPTADSLLQDIERDGMNPVVEQVFDTIIWTMPFAFLFLMMDIMIQQQYGLTPTFTSETSRLAGTMPILGLFVYFTAINTNHTNRLVLQGFQFLLSTISGCCFLYIYSRSTYDVVVRRVPPLGTLWMYSLVRLDLPGVLVSLAIIWAFTVYYNLPILS